MNQFNKVDDISEYDTDGGKLTQRLVHEGLLTKKMVDELKREWKDSVSKDSQKYELSQSDLAKRVLTSKLKTPTATPHL